MSVLSLQQNCPLNAHSPGLLLPITHHFPSSLLLPAVLLLNPRLAVFKEVWCMICTKQDQTNWQHFRRFQIFYLQVLFVLYKQNTAPNVWPHHYLCLLVSCLSFQYYLPVSWTDTQRLSPHLQSGKRGLCRTMLQCWNSLLPLENPLQSCLSTKLLTAPKHSKCWLYCDWYEHCLFGNRILRDSSACTVGHNVQLLQELIVALLLITVSLPQFCWSFLVSDCINI